MNSTNSGFLQGLAAIAKDILAHVSISYDGSKGSIHIDIIPTEPPIRALSESCSNPRNVETKEGAHED